MANNLSSKSYIIQDFDSIIDLLRNRLNWPIPYNISSFDALTHYWSPEDLELDYGTQRRIIGCWQLKLYDLCFFNSKQPWGIFIVQFENFENNVHIERSKTLLRRILRGLVDRQGRSTSLPFWQRDRVLFICTTADFKDFAFAHFTGMKGNPNFSGYPPLDSFKLKHNSFTRQRKTQLAQHR